MRSLLSSPSSPDIDPSLNSVVTNPLTSPMARCATPRAGRASVFDDNPRLPPPPSTSSPATMCTTDFCSLAFGAGRRRTDYDLGPTGGGGRGGEGRGEGERKGGGRRRRGRGRERGRGGGGGGGGEGGKGATGEGGEGGRGARTVRRRSGLRTCPRGYPPSMASSCSPRRQSDLRHDPLREQRAALVWFAAIAPQLIPKNSRAGPSRSASGLARTWQPF